MSEFTRILAAVEHGEARAAEDLLPLLYDELRRLAAVRLASERPGHTLQPTALVHEAYLRLVDCDSPQKWGSHGHFFSAAAEAMRRILVENARRKNSLKRGGGFVQSDLQESRIAAAPQPADDLLALDEALERLAAADSRAVEVVKLRYFSGLTVPQVAQVLGVSPRTVNHLWAYARAWLHQELGATPADEQSNA